MKTKIGIVACTRGFSIDYGYAADGCENQTAIEFAKVLDDQEPSIALHKRTDNTFGVSIGCIPTKQTDNANRNIRVYLTFNGLTEEKSRDILLFYLEGWNQWAETTEPFLQAFHWNRKSTEQDEREWDVDFQIIRNMIENIPHVESSDKRLSDRWEQNNNSINRRKLLDLLQTHTFSASSGFKVVVTGPAPSQDSYNLLQEEVDRYLWTGGRNEKLKDTKLETLPDPEPSNNGNGKKKVIILLILGILLIIIAILWI
ncbi:MAG: hypothetical protein LBF88_05960 [Planctomycetaceae bacterium]|jgi:hypothetical protein|nr:hypothetical protein [Planctomycetaceae bacterium]